MIHKRALLAHCATRLGGDEDAKKNEDEQKKDDNDWGNAGAQTQDNNDDWGASGLEDLEARALH